MAINRGVLGSQTGSMGGITASNWKGRNVYKQKVPSTNSSNSPAQAAQRRKFAALAVLAGQIGPAIRLGYNGAASRVTEQNAFFSANYDTVSDNGTIATINFGLIRTGTGVVGAIEGFEVRVTTASGQIGTNWDNNSNGADALPTDIATVVLQRISTGQFFVQANVDTRAAQGGASVAAFGPGVAPADVRGWAFFKRATSTATGPSATALGQAA